MHIHTGESYEGDYMVGDKMYTTRSEISFELMDFSSYYYSALESFQFSLVF